MEKEKLKIGIDVDEVLAGTMFELNKYYNNLFKTSFKIRDYKVFDLDKTWGTSKKEAVDIVENFYFSSSFKQIRPIEGSVEAVSTLSKNNDLVVLTSRPLYLRNSTNDWIKSHFPNMINEVILNGHYKRKSSKMSKLKNCLDNCLNILIEDNLEISNECSKGGVKVLLMDKPWNQNYGHENIVRVNDWKEILEELK